MNASAFLRALWGDQLPPERCIQTWDLRTKRSTYWGTPNIGTFHDGAPDVFTGMGLAPANLSSRHRAKSNEVYAIAGLWLDIDIKDGGCPYEAAALGLAHAILEPTIVVDSGHGIHAYHLFDGGPWIFRNLAERADASRLVAQWQQLHRDAGGWALDSTHDLARVLRLPDTVNAKDPQSPRYVKVLAHGGPRYGLATLAAVCSDARIAAPLPTTSLHALNDKLDDADPGLFNAKLDALLANSPEFQAAWNHQPAPGREHWSASEYDLSLCSQAAGAMSDAELILLIRAHRTARGENPEKADRDLYVRKTISRARTRDERRAA